MMVHDLDLFRHDQLTHGRVLNVGLHEACVPMQVLSFAGREIINHDYLVSRVQVGFNNVRADEPGSSSDKYSHRYLTLQGNACQAERNEAERRISFAPNNLARFFAVLSIPDEHNEAD